MTTKTKATRKITISGNWRDRHTDEWAGDGTVDAGGSIECSADLGDDAYEAIEAQIRIGQTEGEVTVDGEGRDVTYRWAIVE